MTDPVASNRSILHDKLVHAMSSSRFHQRIHDPDHILAEAAVDELLQSLTASGYILVGETVALPDVPAGVECSIGPPL